MLVVGALVFRYNTNTPLPLLAKALGFGIFVIGGAQLLIPDLVIVFNEWWCLQKLRWERAVSAAYVVLAAFFVVSVSPGASVDAVSTRLRPVYEEIVQSYSLLFPRKQPPPYRPGVRRSQEPESADAQTATP